MPSQPARGPVVGYALVPVPPRVGGPTLRTEHGMEWLDSQLGKK